MRILEWTEDNIAGLSKHGVTRVLIETDGQGRVVREIGLAGDAVKYIASAVDPAIDQRGFFDGQQLDSISREGPDEVPRESFERFWAEGMRQQ